MFSSTLPLWSFNTICNFSGQHLSKLKSWKQLVYFKTLCRLVPILIINYFYFHQLTNEFILLHFLISKTQRRTGETVIKYKSVSFIYFSCHMFGLFFFCNFAGMNSNYGSSTMQTYMQYKVVCVDRHSWPRLENQPHNISGPKYPVPYISIHPCERFSISQCQSLEVKWT